MVAGFFELNLYAIKKIAVVPGIHFSTQASRYIRMNIAHNTKLITEALLGVEEFIQLSRNKAAL